MARITTKVLGSVIIGSKKNDQWSMGILTTDIGIFVTNTTELPEQVDNIAKLRTGDTVEIETYGKFDSKPRNMETGEVIHEASCDKFAILDAELGTGGKKIASLEGREAKVKVVGKGASAPKQENAGEKKEGDDDWG
jgi:hypothetical protein